MLPTGINNGPRRKTLAEEAPRSAGRPTRHAALALSELILDAAQELFLAQGFEQTSLQQIAVAVGATKRTLYVKVGDKADLFAAVVHRLLDRRHEKLNQRRSNGSIKARLTQFGVETLSIALDPDVLRLNRVLVAEAPRFPALANLMEEQMTQGGIGRLTELLRDEVARQRIFVDDPHMSAQLFVAMLIGIPQRAVLYGQEQWTLERISVWVRAAVDLFLQGARLKQGSALAID